MAYSTYTDVQYICGSTLSQTVIEEIIENADNEIDVILDAYELTGSATGAVNTASKYISAAIITGEQTYRDIGMRVLNQYCRNNATSARYVRRV